MSGMTGREEGGELLLRRQHAGEISPRRRHLVVDLPQREAHLAGEIVPPALEAAGGDTSRIGTQEPDDARLCEARATQVGDHPEEQFRAVIFGRGAVANELGELPRTKPRARRPSPRGPLGSALPLPRASRSACSSSMIGVRSASGLIEQQVVGHADEPRRAAGIDLDLLAIGAARELEVERRRHAGEADGAYAGS